MNDDASDVVQDNPVKKAFDTLNEMWGSRNTLQALNMTREYRNVLIYRGYCPLLCALQIYNLSNGAVNWNTLLKPADKEVFKRLKRVKKSMRKQKENF